MAKYKNLKEVYKQAYVKVPRSCPWSSFQIVVKTVRTEWYVANTPVLFLCVVVYCLPENDQGKYIGVDFSRCRPSLPQPFSARSGLPSMQGY